MSRQPKFNDLQLILLSTASQRENGNVLPLPDSIAADEERARKAIPPLLRRKLVQEAPTTDRAQCWREQDDALIGLVITDAGRSAIGADDGNNREEKPESKGDAATARTAQAPADAATAPASVAPSTPRAGSKADVVLTLLRRPEGATLAELVDATGWLPHTTRAALTGLRKKDYIIAKTKRGDVTCYRIESDA